MLCYSSTAFVITNALMPHSSCCRAGIYSPLKVRKWFRARKMQHLGKRWFEHTHLFIPIHKGLHWISVVVDLQQKELTCYDPLEVCCVCGHA